MIRTWHKRMEHKCAFSMSRDANAAPGRSIRCWAASAKRGVSILYHCKAALSNDRADPNQL